MTTTSRSPLEFGNAGLDPELKRLLEDFMFEGARLATNATWQVVLLDQRQPAPRLVAFTGRKAPVGPVVAQARSRRNLIEGAWPGTIQVPIETDHGSVAHVIWTSPEGETSRPPHRESVRTLSALISYAMTKPRVAGPVSENLGRVLAGWRRDAALSQEALASRLAMNRITVSRWESGAQPPSMNAVRRWCEALGVLEPGGATIVQIVDNITPELLRFLREDPERLRQISAGTFEGLVANRLDRMGFAVTLTGACNRKDGGIDIIGAKRDPALGNFLIAAQAKHHRGNQTTGREPVDRILSWKNRAFQFGLVVTNTTFTQDARWIAAQGDNQWFARLRDFEDIKRWLEENFGGDREYMEMPDEIELAPGVTIKVPRPHLPELD